MVATLGIFASLGALIALEASRANAAGYGVPVAFAFLASVFFFASRFTPSAVVGKRTLALRTNGRWAFIRLSEIVTVEKRPRYAIAVHTADDHETSADLRDRVELYATLRERLPARCFKDVTTPPLDGRILPSLVAVSVLAGTVAFGFALYIHLRPPRSDYPIDPGLMVAAIPSVMCGVLLWTAPLRFRVTALHVTVRYALPLGLLQKQERVVLAQDVDVYPDVHAARALEMLRRQGRDDARVGSLRVHGARS